MCPKPYFFLLTFLISSNSSFCLSGCYPSLVRDGIIQWNYPDQPNNISQCYHQLGLRNDVMSYQYYQQCVNNNIVHHAKHTRLPPRAEAPFPSPFRSGQIAPSSSLPAITTFSVDDFLGSPTDQQTDDQTEAFKQAWKEACSSRGGVFLVPENKVPYRLKPIKFKGPCRSHFSIKILGSIEASDKIEDYKDREHWLVFENIRNFNVQGGGTIDGRGMIWWQNSCKINKTKPCQHAPTAVTFFRCKNLIVDGIRIKNGQQIQLSFQKSANVRASNLEVTAPENSPNTDGIHVTHTRYIRITNSLIKTGDDCISIVSGSKNVEATNITCGPGHGISIGSLGKGQSKAHVENVLVNMASLSGTTNGVRIKTWQGGRGHAKNIVFENIAMHNVSNPIIIDQNYCDQQTPCPQRKSGVEVRNVVYKNIKGTSATDVAIKLDCSKSHRCGGIVLENVNLISEGQEEAKADCHNAKVIYRGTVSPTCPQIT